MALASGCLGRHRRDWALAMQAELEAAIDDGRPLTFAAGCLATALREMPTHHEGRFTLVNHAVAVGLIIPIGALLVSGALSGFPFLSAGHADVYVWLIGSSGHTPLLNAYDRGAVPALALLVLMLVAGHLAVPWFLLDCNWSRVAVLARLNAAVTTTLSLFTGILFLDERSMLLPIAGVTVEVSAIVSPIPMARPTRRCFIGLCHLLTLAPICLAASNMALILTLDKRRTRH